MPFTRRAEIPKKVERAKSIVKQKPFKKTAPETRSAVQEIVGFMFHYLNLKTFSNPIVIRLYEISFVKR